MSDAASNSTSAPQKPSDVEIAATDEQFAYCECYGAPEDSQLCDECAADEREQDEMRAEEMFREDVILYGI